MFYSLHVAGRAVRRSNIPPHMPDLCGLERLRWLSISRTFCPRGFRRGKLFALPCPHFRLYRL